MSDRHEIDRTVAQLLGGGYYHPFDGSEPEGTAATLTAWERDLERREERLARCRRGCHYYAAALALGWAAVIYTVISLTAHTGGGGAP